MPTTGIMTSSELQKLNNERLTGEVEDDNNGIGNIRMPIAGSFRPVPSAQAQQPTQAAGLEPEGGEEQEQIIPSIDTQLQGRFPQNVALPGFVQDEALQAGFGRSKFDTDYYPGKDLENGRALAQSGFGKIANGFAKMIGTAATTAAETTVGTIAGALSAGAELIADPNGDGRGFMKTIDAAVNNPVSQFLVDLQKWQEEVFPNYRTDEERSEKYQQQWLRHVFTPNFIGDSILKNFGFTLGAMGGGWAASRPVKSLLNKRMAQHIMRGAVAASQGDAEANAALTKAAEAFRMGKATSVDTELVIKNIKDAAKRINQSNVILQIYGSVLGAMGEGTIEGLMAKQEYYDDVIAKIDSKYKEDFNSLEQEMLDEEQEGLVERVIARREDGSLHSVKRLTEDGQWVLQNKKKFLGEEYDNLRAYAKQQGERLAATTFLLNLPILTTTNALQFGRLMSGGWKTAAATAKKVGGGLNITKNTAGEVAKVAADYTKKGSKFGLALGNSLKVGASEAFEEMAQGFVSSGAKHLADARVSAYNDAGYYVPAMHDVGTWFQKMYEGGMNFVGDAKNWQEGFLGALTGLFGIPGRFWKGEWHGGVLGGIKEAKQKVDASRIAAENLNNLVNSEEFQDRFRGYIRHSKYDKAMKHAAENGDKFAYHTESDKDLINMVMTFADAGMLDDLNTLVDAYGSIAEADASKFRQMLAQEQDKSGYNEWEKGIAAGNYSDKDIVERVKSNAKGIKGAINDYYSLYEALSTRAPKETSPELFKEILFTAGNLKAFERRFLDNYDEITKIIEPYIPIVADMMAMQEGDIKASTEDISKLRDMLKGVYSFPLPLNIPKKLEEGMNGTISVMEELVKQSNSEEAAERVADLRKMAEARKDLYYKLQYLQTQKGREEFQKAAMTQQKMTEQTEQQLSEEQTADANDVEAIREKYNKMKFNEQVNYLRSLESVASTNPAAAEFVKIYKAWDTFQKHIIGKYDIDKSAFGSINPVAGAFLDLIFEKAKSVEDVTEARVSVIPSSNEVKLKLQDSAMQYPISDAVFAKWYDQIASAVKGGTKTYGKSTLLSNMSQGLNDMVMEAMRGDRQKQNPEPAPEPDPSPDPVPKVPTTDPPAPAAKPAPAKPAVNPEPDKEPETKKKEPVQVEVAKQTQRNGKEKTAVFELTTDDDGYVKAKRVGSAIPAEKVKRADAENNGITPEDLARDEWNEETKKGELGKWDAEFDGYDSIRVEKVIKRPDGSLSVTVSIDGTELELSPETGGNPEKVLSILSPKLAESLGVIWEDKEEEPSKKHRGKNGRQGYTDFRNFPEQVTDVYFGNQNDYPDIYFSGEIEPGEKGKYMLTVNDRGNFTLWKSNGKGYTSIDNHVGPEEMGRITDLAVNQFVPMGYPELVQERAAARPWEELAAQNKFEAMLAERFGITYQYDSTDEAEQPDRTIDVSDLSIDASFVAITDSTPKLEAIPYEYLSANDINGTKKSADMQMSVPEISQDGATAGREALKKRKIANEPKDIKAANAAYAKADLSDFVDKEGKKNPAFAATYHWLKTHHAFDYVTRYLNQGDRVMFAILNDPSLPSYDGEPQIVVVKPIYSQEGKLYSLQPLTLLSMETARTKYVNLPELRAAILEQYNSIKGDKPKTFIFKGPDGKFATSIVTEKRPGLIDYDFSGTMYPINSPELEYDRNDPIVYVERTGNLRVVRGDESALGKIKFVQGLTKRHGTLFYLAKAGDDYYIPISLRTAEFNPQTSGLNNRVFNVIRGQIRSLSGLLKDVNAENIAEKEHEKRLAVKALQSLLYIGDIDIELKLQDGVPSYQLTRHFTDGRADEVTSINTKQLENNPNLLLNYFESLHHHIQLQTIDRDKVQDKEYAEAHKTTKIPFLEDYIREGLILTNAKKLRAKGANFYYLPWNGRDAFVPVTKYQEKNLNEIAQKNSLANPASATVAEQKEAKASETPAAPQQSTASPSPASSQSPASKQNEADAPKEGAPEKELPKFDAMKVDEYKQTLLDNGYDPIEVECMEAPDAFNELLCHGLI